jgi:PAS domain S-box-containing protein
VNTGEAFWAKDHPFSVERRGYTEETYFDVSYDPVRDETGEVGGVFCIVRETTGRVLGERRLQTLRDLAARSAEARTEEEACQLAAETLAANAYDIPFAMLYLLDRTGARTRLAGAAGIAVDTVASPREIILAQTSDSLCDWPFAEVTAGRHGRVVDDLSQRFGLTGAKLPGGPWPESPEQAMMLPLARAGQDRSSNPLAGFLIAGISPRRAFDDEYQGFFALVAGQVTTAIANARAYEEERRRAEALAEIDRAKTAFFSNVSHEFRTPLTLMLGPIEDILAEDQLPSRTHERLEVAHRNSLRLLKLVNALLDFSRTEAGRIQAVYEPVDLATFTAELASVFRSAIERAGMSLIIDCPPLSWDTYVDREMWEKIVLNLLSNAFKFTFEGQIEVSLKPAGESVELTVRDTGVGIAAKELPQLFERFHRVVEARGRTYEGSGIGLALVQELVKLHGGTVRVESEPGVGSAFIVSIPFGLAHLPAENVKTKGWNWRPQTATATGARAFVEEALLWLPIETKGRTDDETQSVDATNADFPTFPPTIPSISPARILLADDNSDMRAYVRRLLATNYDVEAVADGEAALQAARECPPDLVLSDVMMPKLDGFGLLRALREDERLATIPVILLSARAGEEARVEGMEAGADDYLIKPFSARELLARIRAHLEMTRLRREAEVALRHSEKLFRELADDAPLIVWMTDDHGNNEFVNKAYLSFFGVEPEDVAERRWMELVHPDDYKSYVQKFFDVSAARLPFRAEARVRRADGEWRWLESYAVPRSAESGRGSGMIGCSADITERTQAEELVRGANERFELAESASNGFVYDWRLREDTVERSQGMAAVLGYRPGEVPDTPQWWFEQINPSDLARVQAEVELVFAARGDKITTEYRVRRRDGHYIWVQDSARIFRDESGRVTRVVGTTVDISMRKRAEEEIARLLAEERAAREVAEQATRAKDEFLAVVSHELRSPLNAVLGWSNMLRSQRGDDPYIARVTETIQRNGKVQLQLIEDLLDTARIITGKMKLEVQPVELVVVIAAALDTVRTAADSKGIVIATDFDPEAGQITGDPARLQQVVWNLVSNAIKFTPEGGRVWVGLRRVGSGVRIVVQDTGQGIEPDLLPYVFDRFKQGDSSTSRRFGGLGLGLSLVKHLVELHGGVVTAESPGIGQGTTITVSLPVRAVRAMCQAVSRRDGAATADQTAIRRPPSNMLMGVRALVVDDEADARELITLTLEQYGARVTSVDSAAAALDALEPRLGDRGSGEPFDIMICDIGMPGTDGYELIRRVRTRQDKRVSYIKAVALTAYARSENRIKALRAGFQMYVAKPVDEAELAAVIGALTGRTPGQGQTTGMAEGLEEIQTGR